MQNQPSHWRKRWPQGDIDDSTNDEDVLNMFDGPEKKAAKPKERYPWTYDDDVKETKLSLETAEKLTGKKLSKEGVRNGGLDMINTYDNEKRVFERNLPYGPTWHEWAAKPELV